MYIYVSATCWHGDDLMILWPQNFAQIGMLDWDRSWSLKFWVPRLGEWGLVDFTLISINHQILIALLKPKFSLFVRELPLITSPKVALKINLPCYCSLWMTWFSYLTPNFCFKFHRTTQYPTDIWLAESGFMNYEGYLYFQEFSPVISTGTFSIFKLMKPFVVTKNGLSFLNAWKYLDKVVAISADP